MSTIPSMAEVRARIEQRTGDSEYRFALKATLLRCGRVSETVGAASSGEPAYGPIGTDAEAEVWQSPVDQDRREKALVFHTKTAKRGGMIRDVGLPVDYEPWALPLAEFMWDRPNQPVFPFTRQALGTYVRDNEIFEGLEWPVQEYSIFEEPAVRDAKGRVLESAKVQKVEGHLKPFTVHSLRDVRATYLILECGFSGVDLAIHGGWAIQRAETGISKVMARYLNIYREWQRPFPKLLRR